MSTNVQPCVICGESAAEEITVPFSTQMKYDGKVHTVEVSALAVIKCKSCGELVIASTGHSQLRDALRTSLRLLTPAQIRANRKYLGRQEDLADALGIAVESISRWECGLVIQSRANDNMLRAYFGLPEFREFLYTVSLDPRLGTTVEWGWKGGHVEFRGPDQTRVDNDPQYNLAA